MPGCSECGAREKFGSCADLFNVLLALDHERRQPWGRLHGVSVACYLLQHPSRSTPSSERQLVSLLRAFDGGGIGAIESFTTSLVAGNRRGRPSSDRGSALGRKSTPDCTIEHVSVDGSFPAPGFEVRLRRWVGSTLSVFEP